MAEVLTFFTNLANLYTEFLSSISPLAQKFLNLFLLISVVVLYSIFIWKLYRFTATKNIIKLNLAKYNTSDDPFLMKFLAGLFYFIENIVIFPFLLTIWYGFFTLFILVLTESLDIDKVLIISLIIVGAIRVTAYYKEDLSKDVAKLLPFTLMFVSLLEFTKLDFNHIIENLSQLPTFLNNIIFYIIFLFAIEILLRLIDLVLIAFGVNKQEDELYQ